MSRQKRLFCTFFLTHKIKMMTFLKFWVIVAQFWINSERKISEKNYLSCRGRKAYY